MTTAVSLASLGSVITAPVGSAPSYTCRAWVNFNGTGTVAIRASGNVSSITDIANGTYQVNFVSAMPDVSYSAVYTAVVGSTWTGSGNQVYEYDTNFTKVQHAENGAGNDVIYNNVAVFR